MANWRMLNSMVREYVEIVPSEVESMTLLQARIITNLNLSPDDDPETEGFLITQGDIVRWMTQDEFENSPLVQLRKR